VGSPLGYEGSVTSGVVGRVAFNEIQTDAAAYPGISGGPAVDAEGSWSASCRQVRLRTSTSPC
jgi:S1-C subfamily serine protease